jgi:hypothetical protein
MNTPAFPAPAGVSHITEQGMTLRDYFAAKAMQGFCTTVDVSDPDYHELWEPIAQESYEIADAMLKARQA